MNTLAPNGDSKLGLLTFKIFSINKKLIDVSLQHFIAHQQLLGLPCKACHSLPQFLRWGICTTFGFRAQLTSSGQFRSHLTLGRGRAVKKSLTPSPKWELIPHFNSRKSDLNLLLHECQYLQNRHSYYYLHQRPSPLQVLPPGIFCHSFSPRKRYGEKQSVFGIKQIII